MLISSRAQSLERDRPLVVPPSWRLWPLWRLWPYSLLDEDCSPDETLPLESHTDSMLDFPAGQQCFSRIGVMLKSTSQAYMLTFNLF